MEIKYKIDSFSFEKLKKCIKLPSFQRSVVWTTEKKANFIETVINGLPFGSLLLYKEKPDEYLLVDGLQRYTTLEDFNREPYKYINFDKLCKESIDKIISILKGTENISTDYSKLRNDIINTIKNNIKFDLDDSVILNSIINDIPIVKNIDCISEILSLISNLKNKFNIASVEIPLICFYGEYDELPKIFERMNANGTQLSKYEIYAAKWSNIIFEYHDASILQLVDEKYHDMMDKTGVEILNYSEGQIIKEQKINLFEFCFAFGKQLQKNYPNIFGIRNFTTSDVASIGFTLLTVILSDSPSNMNAISKLFNDMDSTKVKKLVYLKEKILECVKSVDKILSQYIILLDGKTNISKYIEYQMICIISTLFKIRYTLNNKTFDITENSNIRKLSSSFEKNMPKRYLYDIISEYWNGSGDSKISDEMSKNITENRYLTTISTSSWETQLYEWMTEQTQKPMKNIPTENKLFLNYLIKLNNTHIKYIDAGRKFEFEYIIAKDRFQKKFKGRSGMSSIGNLCILPQYETRSKQELTLYEAINNKSLVYDIKEDVITDFMYPEKSELTFLYSDETFTYDNYLSFIKSRQQYLINKFISLIEK